MNTINAAIQVLPQKTEKMYAVVDKAIEVIANSGMKYTVCPFETVIEGTWEEVMKTLEEIKNTVLNHAPSTLINIKIQASNIDVHIKDKMEKYS